MALIECPECGKEISDKASACPHCGAPQKPKEQKSGCLGMGCLVMILFPIVIVIAGSFYPSSDSPRSTQTPPEPVDVATTPAPAPRQTEASSGGTVPVTQRYPGPWREETIPAITIALVANHVQGCGDLRWRASVSDRGEYLVICSADGENWTAYIVWISSKRVQGPFQPDSSLDLPHY
jgi:hypothetical protein